VAVAIKMDASYEHHAKISFRGANGEVVAPGELWKQARTCQNFEAIRDQGRRGFFKGSK